MSDKSKLVSSLQEADTENITMHGVEGLAVGEAGGNFPAHIQFLFLMII